MAALTPTRSAPSGVCGGPSLELWLSRFRTALSLIWLTISFSFSKAGGRVCRHYAVERLACSTQNRLGVMDIASGGPFRRGLALPLKSLKTILELLRRTLLAGTAVEPNG